MFERFTQNARQVVVGAQGEARKLGHTHIGTEHILLAMLAQPDSMPGRLLNRRGLTHAQAVAGVKELLKEDGDDLDAGLLGELGIDLGAVREKVEAAFGPGALDRPPQRGRRGIGTHIPLTKRAKKALELSLREAIALKHNFIGDGHILLGLLREGEGLGARVIADAGMDFEVLRREIKDEFD